MDNISKAAEAANKKLPSIKFDLNEPLYNHTSLKIGGPVRLMFFPNHAEEMADIYAVLREYDVDPVIIGNGTNILAEDGKPLEIVAIKTTGIDHVGLAGETEISAGAGISLSRLAAFACEHGLTGLEFAHGIPGSLGGAVSMNAGAYGSDMKDVVVSTNVLNVIAPGSDAIGARVSGSPGAPGSYTVKGEEHNFSYRRSRFTASNEVALSSVLRLEKGDRDSIWTRMEELSARRRASQPLDIPSAGSVFKRPKNGYAAALIEQAGLKGFAIGGARVSDKHAGFIVNCGGATFADMAAVIEHIIETVHKRFGIVLEPEIKIIRG